MKDEKIYVSSSCIKKDCIADVILELVQGGIVNIELSGGTNYYDGIETDLIRLRNQYNLKYTCHAYFPPPKNHFVINLASCNDMIYKQSINHYINCIEMLERLECNVLSIHAGFLVEVNTDEVGKRLGNQIVYDENEAYERFCAAYEYLSKLCTNKGITLYLENNVLSRENYEAAHNRNYLMMTDYKSIMKMKDLLEFKLLLDMGHLHVSAKTLGLDFEEECTNLQEHVKWMHISENNGICDEHRPLIEGSEILNFCYKMNKSNIPITLETVGTLEEILFSKKLL